MGSILTQTDVKEMLSLSFSPKWDGRRPLCVWNHKWARMVSTKSDSVLTQFYEQCSFCKKALGQHQHSCLPASRVLHETKVSSRRATSAAHYPDAGHAMRVVTTDTGNLWQVPVANEAPTTGP